MHVQQDVIRIARSYVGTPFHTDGRIKGVGLDCIGLPSCVAKELGGFDGDTTPYRLMPKATRLEQAVKDFKLTRLSRPLPGSFLALRIRNNDIAEHFAILTERGTIIHVSDYTGHVTEHTFDPRWQERVISAWAFPGVEYKE